MAFDTSDPTPPALAALVHPDKDVRQRAAVALGERAEPTLAPAIAALLWQERDFFVRETLTWVLTRTPGPAVEAATTALGAEDPSVRLQALHLLSKIADPDSAAAVAAHLDDPDCAVMDKARWALARIGDPSVVPLLVDRLGQGELAHRDSMTTTLAQIGAPAVPSLITALTEADAGARAHAAEVLCFIGAPGALEAIGPLVESLGDDHPDVRLSAVLALRELVDHPVARGALRQAAAEHEDARVRAVAAAGFAGH